MDITSNISEKKQETGKRQFNILGRNNSKEWQKPERLAYAYCCTELPNHRFIVCKDGGGHWSDICRQHLIQQRRQSFFTHSNKTDPCCLLWFFHYNTYF